MSFSMANRLGHPPIYFSDSLVGQVLPRVHVGRHHAGASGSSIPTLQSSSKGEAPMFAPYPPRGLGYERHTVDAATGKLRSLVGSTGVVPQPVSILYNVANKPNSDSTKVTGKRKMSSYCNTALRRQQCRTNQARYRDRQRNAQMQLEKRVEQLQQEVGSLKRKYRYLASRERSNQSPWSIVAEVFRLLETSFHSPWRVASTQEMKNHAETRQILAILERSFAHDAAMGELRGVEALVEQLLLFSQYVGTPHLKLQRIESVAPGVMAARAKLSMTVTELTLRHAFPHLEEPASEDRGDGRGLLYQRLLGQRVECNCSLAFLFDEDSDRVVRLETSIDLTTPFLELLGSLKDVSKVLEHARVSSECVIGCSHTNDFSSS